MQTKAAAPLLVIAQGKTDPSANHSVGMLDYHLML
jgi:hypothetical protein